VREIPPRSEQKNVMQIAMQSRIKIFWRPKAVEVKNGQVNLTGKFDISRTASGLTLKNNSPTLSPWVILARMAKRCCQKHPA
jgi:P pilus assembly chaperone PapD